MGCDIVILIENGLDKTLLLRAVEYKRFETELVMMELKV
jgi:hypothetical protein